MLVGQTIGSGAYRFEIGRELGSGAMGTVYRATFHKNEEVSEVALKVVALGLLGNESAMARFDRVRTSSNNFATSTSCGSSPWDTGGRRRSSPWSSSMANRSIAPLPAAAN